MSLSQLLRRRLVFTKVFGEDLAVLFAVAILTMAFIFYEIAGLTVPGMHTISYLAHHHWYLRAAILLAFLLTPIWWVIHSGQEIPR